MTIGLTYDLRSEYLAEGFSEEETAEFDRDDTMTAMKTLRSLGHTPTASAMDANWRPHEWPAGAGTWCSTLPKACAVLAARPRCRRC